MIISQHHLSRLTGSDTPTPEQAGRALLELLNKNAVNMQEIELLVNAGADLSMCDEYKRNMVFICAIGGHAAAIPLLIRHGVDPNSHDNRGQTCIENAIILRHLPCITALIENGVDIETACARGKTPLLMAVSYNSEDIVAYLLKAGANLEAKDWYDQTAIDIAVTHERDALVKRLGDFQDNEWLAAKVRRYTDKGMPLPETARNIRKFKPRKP